MKGVESKIIQTPEGKTSSQEPLSGSFRAISVKPVSLVVCVLMEAVQYYIPGKSFSFLDMASNIIGGIFALIVGGLWKKFKYNNQCNSRITP